LLLETTEPFAIAGVGRQAKIPTERSKPSPHACIRTAVGAAASVEKQQMIKEVSDRRTVACDDVLTCHFHLSRVSNDTRSRSAQLPKHQPTLGDLSFFIGFTIAAVVYLALKPARSRRESRRLEKHDRPLGGQKLTRRNPASARRGRTFLLTSDRRD
jgi:hypothetical protein